METISPEERVKIIDVLEREIKRLEALIAEYRAARKPSNVIIKAMADEGSATMDERIKATRALVVRLRGPQETKRV